MKKTVLFVVMAIATLCAAATDRLYIEDLSISAGETRTVSIMLDNETAYTAFQTDLYLPAGLTVEQEDGDFIFDLTSRKGRDHNIATQVQSDGAIRIMSYSPTIKTYSGNSGALVTFNVTATADFSAPSTIQLKNTLFTTKSGEEISFNDEICNVTSDVILKDLTGEITFTQGGKEVVTYSDFAELLDTTYTTIDICYTGPEEVTFSIKVNGVDLFDNSNEDGYDFTDVPQWIDDINGYRIQLRELVLLGGDDYGYSANYNFEVKVHANGYNDLFNIENIDYYTPGPTPTLDGMEYSEFGIKIYIDSELSRVCLLVNGEEEECYSDDWESPFYYIVERYDHDYDVSIQPGNKTSMMDFYLMGEEYTITVPAINCGILIQQCDSWGYDEKKSESVTDEGDHYASIQFYGDAVSSSCVDKWEITINGYQITYYPDQKSDDYIVFTNPEDNLFVIDLLPFGEPNGGEYFIQATAIIYDSYTGEHILTADAHLEYYVPIEAPTIVTQMTNDAVIVNMSSDLEYKKFIVDGEEVLELPYVAGRTNHDYYITVQAGHSPDSVRWAWTEEMTILIPAKDLPILRGDADGDGNVNISDVAALIDYLLSGNDALVPGKPDVDLNGAITIADVTTLIDYLLSDRWPGETSFTVNGVTFKLLDIAGGIFSMGATPEQEEGAHDNEKPVHEVALSPFSMSVTEVTQELWLAVMGTNPSRFSSNLNRPVENVSWNDCQVFIAKLNELSGQNFRLPTEAEWEFAARGGMNTQGYKYAGSNDLDEVAWYNYNAHAVGSSSPDYGTHAVATKAPNELGLYDMTGNVWEWCQDWSGTYSEAQQINPTGPETGTNRVMRGGGWTNYPSLLRIAARAGYKPTFKGNFTGFRLAL